MVTKRMGDRYVLDFAPANRFLPGQMLCTQQVRPTGETYVLLVLS